MQTTMTDPFLSPLPTTALDVRHLYRALEAGTARLRVAIHATHTADQLDSLAAAIREVLR